MDRDITLKENQSCIDFTREKEECLPISSYGDLMNWNPSSQRHHTETLHQRIDVKNDSKVLVCHDMKGGYLEDRFINGSQDENYYFIHWSIIDIFVYFSHHFVTIPPCSWITAAHRNGVKILGTFITEWDAGAEICESIFSDEPSVLDVCKKLVKIAEYCQFDGWLINIENKIQANQVLNLENFVLSLTQMMHKALPDSLVIWYDSVINTGELKWQNELNEFNRNFFLNCDGIFLNYIWKKENLQKSLTLASSRATDVYVGVDVFGRGCFGGGGFSTDIAAAEIKLFGLSIAIFAPGWVYECLDIKNFKENQYVFWSSLTKLYPIRKIQKLPYYSSFCPGFGKMLFRNGKMICNEPWFNMNVQQCQPSFHYTHCQPDNGIISFYEEDSFNGGACLSLSGKMNSDKKCLHFEILSSHFVLDASVLISYVFKALSEEVDVSIVLNMQTVTKPYRLFLLEQNVELKECALKRDQNLFPISPIELQNSNYKLKNSEESWIRRVYLLKSETFQDHIIDSINVCAQYSKPSCGAPISVLIGELEILPFHKTFELKYKDLICITENKITSVSCTLEWTQDATVYCSDLYVTTNGKIKFLCTTSQFYYSFKQSTNFLPDHIEFQLHPQSRNKFLKNVTLKICI